MEIHHTEYTTNISYRVPRRKKAFKALLWLSALCVLTVAGLAYGLYTANEAPADFPIGLKVEVEEGQSAAAVAKTMKEAGVVKSELLLYLILTTAHDPTGIQASAYKFKEPQTTREVAARLAKGEFGIDVVRFVHYEGERNELLAERAEQLLEAFDAEEFMKLAADKEGYMFPDTYIIPETYTAKDLYELLLDNYEAKVGPLRPAIVNSNFTEYEVLIIASLLEREANSRDTKQQVAGIIANRLAEGMALQLDASIEYDLNKPLNELVPSDLRKDSPYNTYTNTGLPPTPIGNPGLTAIEAVLRPLESNYLFYLTGKDGNFYFATTLQEHNRNIDRYLR